jgi:hypothetical protein
MTLSQIPKLVRIALWLSPAALVVVAFFAAMPWLKTLDDVIVTLISAAAAIFVMGYAVFLAARVNRRLDEVEIAGQRFATTQGWMIGCVAAVVVMLFPPALNALADLANAIAMGSPDKAVRLGIVIGFMMVVILQTLGVVAVSFWWGRRIGRA